MTNITITIVVFLSVVIFIGFMMGLILLWEYLYTKYHSEYYNMCDKMYMERAKVCDPMQSNLWDEQERLEAKRKQLLYSTSKERQELEPQIEMLQELVNNLTKEYKAIRKQWEEKYKDMPKDEKAWRKFKKEARRKSYEK